MFRNLQTVGRRVALPLVTVLACLAWYAVERRDVERLRSTLADAQASLQQEDEALWQETAENVTILLEKVGYWQEPLSQSEWQHLRQAYFYFQRRLNQPYQEQRDLGQRINDLSFFSRVAHEIRQFGEAEKAIREIAELSESLAVVQGGRTEALLLQADALNSIACLLVRRRQFAAAEGEVRRSGELWQRLLAETPHDGQVTVSASFALRNLGMIRELQGSDGTVDVERAIAVSARFAEKGEFVSSRQKVTLLSFLADSCQMAGFLHLRHNRLSDAEAAWKRSLDFCQQLMTTVEEVAHWTPAPPPSRQFRRALTAISNDLERLQDLRIERASRQTDASRPAAPTDAAPHPDVEQQWMWMPLMPDFGLNLLSIDPLVSGRLPGEFERQEAIMLSWIPDVWSEPTQLAMVAAIQETTRVVLLVADDTVRSDALHALSTAGIPLDRIEFVTIQTDTIWCRDFGPVTVRGSDGSVRLAEFMFCDSFDDPWALNDSLTHRWARVTGWPVFQVPVLLEAGGFLTNGAGLCLASSMLQKKNAVSGISEQQLTAELKRLTGANQVIYLEPIQGEPTGHVDWFTVFTSPETVVIGDYYGIDSANARILDQNAARLADVMTPNGPLQVERIPMPPPGDIYFGGTYTNVVFANGNLLVPTWPEAPAKMEKKALSVYRRLLPDWKIIPIPSGEFGRKHGSLHCATMNLSHFRMPVPAPVTR